MLKGTCWAEAKPSSEKIKPAALAVCLYEGIKTGRQAVSQQVMISQSVENSEFHSNLLEALLTALKTVLDLILPNQYCQGVMKEL